MSNIFFTSDHHFDHTNIIRYSNRPFSSIEEMNEILIQRWNDRIKPEDKVYHLGDFCFKDRQKFISRLNGKKVFIRGSHDKTNDPYMMVETFKEYRDEYNNPRVITLCHYAMRSWDRSHYATWSLYGHCFDSVTEVLTRNGWKKRSDIKKTDEVVSLNLETGLLEYNNINEIIDYKFTGDSINVISKGLDLNLTPNHTLIEIKRDASFVEYKKFCASDIDAVSRRKFIKSGNLNLIGLPLSDNLLRLLVWIAADGSLCNSSLIRVQLYKNRKIERLENLLKDLKINYRKYPTNKGGYYINFTRPEEIAGYKLKPLDSQFQLCNEHQVDVVLEEYSATDGKKYGLEKDLVVIWTSKKVEADILQIMCITNGYQCNMSERFSHGFSKDISYTLVISKGKYRYLTHTASRVSRIYVENTPYWCLNVKNGTLFIRRNGKPVIVGNSHGKLEPYGLSFDAGVDCWNFYPVSFEEVEEKMKTLKPIVDFRNKTGIL